MDLREDMPRAEKKTKNPQSHTPSKQRNGAQSTANLSPLPHSLENNSANYYQLHVFLDLSNLLQSSKYFDSLSNTTVSNLNLSMSRGRSQSFEESIVCFGL
uniref:Uncharacterized protein n=1 Tax=Corethron hystrix TaxID=216773 RepID=A0A7S1FUF4_9STRA